MAVRWLAIAFLLLNAASLAAQSFELQLRRQVPSKHEPN